MTKEELLKIKAEFEKNKSSVIDRLLTVVGDCQPAKHVNVK